MKPTPFCLLLLGLAVSAPAAERVSTRPPNILVIMSDEHHAGVMGNSGDSVARTPHLDRLARSGVKFDAHYCSSPICTPSRQTFTTGKYVSSHNVWTNTVGVPEDRMTLPKVMRAAGYQSYLIGKMHYKGGRNYGFTLLDKGPRASNDDEMPPAKGSPAAEPKPRKRLPAGVFPPRGDELGEEFRPLGETLDTSADPDVGRRDAAIQFLQNRPVSAKPFFLTVGFIAPHYPLVAPPEFLARYKDRVPAPHIPSGYLETLPLNYQHLRNDRKLERVPSQTVKLALEAYYARVEWMDQQIGQVLEALARSPFAENTIVVYTSDHGENMGEHGLWWKNCMYDSAARVPLIMSWPKRWAGGQVRSGACGMVDLVKTLAECAGATVPADWQGDSMVGWLDRGDFPWKDRAVVEYYAGYVASGIAMIREGPWKYVYHTRPSPEREPEVELFHLHDDPRELHNLARSPEHRERIRALHAHLVAEIGEDPETTESRWRAGATPEWPQGRLAGGAK
ncbi:MAG: sulfatase-like hydrolase/transferase [Opitutaceae bacterium]|nr:sulfatase-like hydrolase/transferase [Opitutaceae bacterium]